MSNFSEPLDELDERQARPTNFGRALRMFGAVSLASFAFAVAAADERGGDIQQRAELIVDTLRVPEDTDLGTGLVLASLTGALMLTRSAWQPPRYLPRPEATPIYAPSGTPLVIEDNGKTYPMSAGH
jgi:hypothetical protein